MVLFAWPFAWRSPSEGLTRLAVRLARSGEEVLPFARPNLAYPSPGAKACPACSPGASLGTPLGRGHSALYSPRLRLARPERGPSTGSSLGSSPATRLGEGDSAEFACPCSSSVLDGIKWFQSPKWRDFNLVYNATRIIQFHGLGRKLCTNHEHEMWSF